jgi:hypothetical protein
MPFSFLFNRGSMFTLLNAFAFIFNRGFFFLFNWGHPCVPHGGTRVNRISRGALAPRALIVDARVNRRLDPKLPTPKVKRAVFLSRSASLVLQRGSFLLFYQRYTLRIISALLFLGCLAKKMTNSKCCDKVFKSL